MISGGDGGSPRQERKRKSGGRKKQGAGGVSAGWKKPTHADLVRVDPALLRSLKQWSTKKTFTHQFRVAATAAPVTLSPPAVFTPLKKPTKAAPGLAAVKYAQAKRRDRAASIAENLHRQKHGATGRPGSGPSSFGELYQYYKRNGMLEVFFSLFPGG